MRIVSERYKLLPVYSIAVGAMAEEEVRILNSVISDLETELKTKGKTKQSRLAGKSEKG
jgi:hypothetical protein